jgi:hypothetical protein
MAAPMSEQLSGQLSGTDRVRTARQAAAGHARPGGPGPGRLPRRDLVLLPGIALLTVLLLLLLGEAAARVAWPEQERDACVVHDPVLGKRGLPNCVSTIRKAESPWVTTHTNDCGYRSPTSCRPLPPGMPRVAVIGSSTSAGYLVAEPDLFTTLAAAKLRSLCGRTVDFQNLGVAGLGQAEVVQRVDAALATRPSVLVWVFVPFDVENVPLAEADVPAAPPPPSLLNRIHGLAVRSRAMLVAQHYFYRNLGLYVRTYLGQADRSDFLRAPLSSLWQRRLAYLDRSVAAIAEKAHAAGVPFMLVLASQQAQAALMTMPPRPGIDPLAFGRALDALAARHGGRFVDLTGSFAGKAWRDDLFYPVDGHLAAGGNRLLADALAASLAGGDYPAFQSCAAAGRATH